MPDNKNRLVYSTDQKVEKKGTPAKLNPCQSTAPSQQKVYVRLDRKGRGGKSVTLIEGLQLSSKEIDSLLKQLKSRLGTGGAMKDSAVEIQGDHRDAVMAYLEGLNYRPKRAGG
jgi:translation initiation factor 1